jgi:imidazole glycerol-phosphate synthase subunit HisH
MSQVAIIDYDMGNVRSVINAVDYCGFDPILTADHNHIRDADRIILPGDGAFGDAMAHLRKADLIDLLEDEVLKKGKPFLGICVGMQILASTYTEHTEDDEGHVGLGWFPAKNIPIAPADPALKVPQMGWNALQKTGSHALFSGFESFDPSFYFVHSYWMEMENPAELLGTVDYGLPLTAMIGRDNIVATQFHPEKSQDNGIELLTNFLNWNP